MIDRRSICIFFLLVGCSEPATSPISETSFSLCDGTIVRTVVTRDRDPIGPSSNAIRKFGDVAFVVESGTNTVSQIRDDASPYLDVGNERNPWDVWADDDEVWVTNYLANSVSVFDRASGALVEELTDSSFDNPSAVVATETTVFVSNVSFRSQMSGRGTVTAIDRGTRTVKWVRDTDYKNPQFLSLVSYDDVSYLAVVDSGEFDLDQDGAFVKSDGALELWQLDAGAVVEAKSYVLPMVADRRIGSPSEAHQAGRFLYLGSGSAPLLFKFDLETAAWLRGTDDPILLYATDGDALHRTTFHRDLIWVTAFNRDAMYVFDPECDETVSDAIALDDSELLAGPFGTVFFRDEFDFGRFILSNANAIGRIEVYFP